MSRSPAGLLAALLLGACTSPLPPTGTPPPTETPSAAAATLTITGSGDFCGPWWYGCGAYLLVEAPGWSLPDDWRPRVEDTRFMVVSDVSEKEPTRVTGVMQMGRAWIEPGAYRLAVLETHSSDDIATQPPPLDVFLQCADDLTVVQGTASVNIDVRFGPGGCTIAVSKHIPSPTPSL